jgi:hypothetical protein
MEKEKGKEPDTEINSYLELVNFQLDRNYLLIERLSRINDKLKPRTVATEAPSEITQTNYIMHKLYSQYDRFESSNSKLEMIINDLECIF